MSDIERAIEIGRLLWEAKAIIESKPPEAREPRLTEIASAVNHLHGEMSQETKDYFAAQDFASDTPLHTFKRGGL